MLIFNYGSKAELKESVGKPLNFTETSVFGPEYRKNGSITGCNRPSITGIKTKEGKPAREFFATVTMREGLIESVV